MDGGKTDRAWRMWEAPIDISNAQYQFFTRLYNRRRCQQPSDIIAAGYPNIDLFEINLESGEFGEMLSWCHKNLKDRHIYAGARLFFVDENAQMLFNLRWLK
jgi:hypothetical protein